MSSPSDGMDPRFGGDWTRKKLDILERYLRAYTSVFKNQPWCRLVYVDAFAGTGRIDVGVVGDEELYDPEHRTFIEGSAKRALRIDDRPFDEFIFVEKDLNKCARLEVLQESYLDRSISVINDDANQYLKCLKRSSFQDAVHSDWRGVLFVDPYGAQVDWATIEHVARIEKLDMWLLFPVGLIARILPREQLPNGIAPGWAKRLKRVYGGDEWRELYSFSPPDLFGDSHPERDPGVDGLCRIYKKKLKEVFGLRLLEQSRILHNSKSSPLFEFIFCAGSSSPQAVGIAKKVAKHLLKM